ncbi:serine/threonine-protein kinase fray2 isoform X2 [Palaemon carinicauda]|uniref:serine/threonine-protein kinase fray2 isoform X2 n=1 Tax=Palaemon carinicauda TaxID=392227 RepID=UPI0035B59537
MVLSSGHSHGSMASIEVSLGWKRRREALLETLPRAARDLVRELDGLHQALRDKDNTIQSLKTQITNLGGTVGGAGEGGGILTEAEKKTIQERLNKVQGEMDAKKVAIKNLKLALDKIDITDNIDVRIRAAELEYELEREELNILNLKEESNVLGTRLQENTSSTTSSSSTSSNGGQGSKVTLHALMSSAGGGAALGGANLVTLSLPHTPGNPPFHVIPRPPMGCIIDWAVEDTKLKKGDRLLEVNGSNVVGAGLEMVTRLMGASNHLNLVIARPTVGTGTCGRRSDGRVEKQLEDRSREVKDLVSRLDKALKEKEIMKSDNTRLNHRISYLEEQVSELQTSLQKMRESTLGHSEGEAIVTTSHPGATVIQVFQKGDQKLAVASPDVNNSGMERAQQYPTLPRIRSPDSSMSSSPSSSPSDVPLGRQHHTLGHASSRPTSAADQRRRMLSPRPESKNEDSRPPSRTKPVPPKKPERLSLQRTTSMQSMEELPTNSRSSNASAVRSNGAHAWNLHDNDLASQEENDYVPHMTYDQDRLGYRSREHSFDRLQERSHYASRDRSYDRLSNGDGSVRMVVNSNSPVTGEHLSRRPSPQGAASTTIQEVTPRRGNYRSHSPDSSYHLESDRIDGQENDIFRAEIYSSSSNTSHYSSYSHQHHQSDYHRHSHGHYHLQAPSTPVASRNSTLSVPAKSPCGHEQWC